VLVRSQENDEQHQHHIHQRCGVDGADDVVIRIVVAKVHGHCAEFLMLVER
jgi:hypothetical protein